MDFAPPSEASGGSPISLRIPARVSCTPATLSLRALASAPSVARSARYAALRSVELLLEHERAATYPGSSRTDCRSPSRDASASPSRPDAQREICLLGCRLSRLTTGRKLVAPLRLRARFAPPTLDEICRAGRNTGECSARDPRGRPRVAQPAIATKRRRESVRRDDCRPRWNCPSSTALPYLVRVSTCSRRLGATRRQRFVVRFRRLVPLRYALTSSPTRCLHDLG